MYMYICGCLVIDSRYLCTCIQYSSPTLSRKLVIYQNLVDHGMVSLFSCLDKDDKLSMLNLHHRRPYLIVINYISVKVLQE